LSAAEGHHKIIFKIVHVGSSAAGGLLVVSGGGIDDFARLVDARFPLSEGKAEKGMTPWLSWMGRAALSSSAGTLLFEWVPMVVWGGVWVEATEESPG